MSDWTAVVDVFSEVTGAERERRARKLSDLHESLATGPEVHSIVRIPLGRFASSTDDAFLGLAPVTGPFVVRESACFVVTYDDERGQKRVLLFNPIDEERAEAAAITRRYTRGNIAARSLHRLLTRGRTNLRGLLRAHGFVPTDIDDVCAPHLMRMDLRGVLGGLNEPPLLPRAVLHATRAELARARDPSSATAAHYVPGGVDGVDDARVDLIEGPRELGAGIALLPLGHDGSLSLVVRTKVGVLVISDRAVLTECYTPAASEISGLAEETEALGLPVLPHRPVRGSLEDVLVAMLVEREIAGASHDDERFCSVVPTAPLIKSRFAPRLSSTYTQALSEATDAGAPDETE